MQLSPYLMFQANARKHSGFMSGAASAKSME